MDSTDRFMPEFGVRVFLVEDNPEHSFIAVTVIRQLLGEASEVIVAENAEEAVGLIGQFTENDRPDLMLVDLRLPDNGGFSVLTAARSSEACTAVPTFVPLHSLCRASYWPHRLHIWLTECAWALCSEVCSPWRFCCSLSGC